MSLVRRVGSVARSPASVAVALLFVSSRRGCASRVFSPGGRLAHGSWQRDGVATSSASTSTSHRDDCNGDRNNNNNNTNNSNNNLARPVSVALRNAAIRRVVPEAPIATGGEATFAGAPSQRPRPPARTKPASDEAKGGYLVSPMPSTSGDSRRGRALPNEDWSWVVDPSSLTPARSTRTAAPRTASVLQNQPPTRQQALEADTAPRKSEAAKPEPPQQQQVQQRAGEAAASSPATRAVSVTQDRAVAGDVGSVVVPVVVRRRDPAASRSESPPTASQASQEQHRQQQQSRDSNQGIRGTVFREVEPARARQAAEFQHRNQQGQHTSTDRHQGLPSQTWYSRFDDRKPSRFENDQQRPQRAPQEWEARGQQRNQHANHGNRQQHTRSNNFTSGNNNYDHRSDGRRQFSGQQRAAGTENAPRSPSPAPSRQDWGDDTKAWTARVPSSLERFATAAATPLSSARPAAASRAFAVARSSSSPAPSPAPAATPRSTDPPPRGHAPTPTTPRAVASSWDDVGCAERPVALRGPEEEEEASGSETVATVASPDAASAPSVVKSDAPRTVRRRSAPSAE